MTLLSEILDYNEAFVRKKEYLEYSTDKFPDKRMIIISCMDTRLVELLPKSMNIRNGDVKFIKTAGAVVSHPFGSVMRSVLVAAYELKADEVFVIGHYDCGMSAINADVLLEKMTNRGISKETISTLENSGIHLKHWLRGFDNVADSVQNSVSIIKNHPLLPKDVAIHGLVISPQTGKLDVIVDGYKQD
ncbi:carbonic anhydrase [Bacillus sp. M6-12]|uniref:beta-class carbonic anhydrase n=1 Tax=Bacillus sp. M6-12 TaxID=2054166 RepID=UPI000C7731A4|nr:carbonic anhydrase [Bacillus sp. M6-12]PLS17204.1 carbonic anhydrase [Bacillus sp. M6-12]